MLEICCRLTCLLNDLCAGRTTAPHAEAELLRMAAAHHVHDPDETLGLSEHDPLSSVPIRMALARISHVPPRHSRAVGSAAACPRSACWSARSGSGQPSRSRRRCSRRLSSSSTTMPAGTAWIPHPVGSAMQWTVVRAVAPLPPPTPADAAPLLRSAICATAAQLNELSMMGGRRPDVVPPYLTGHRPADQRLLDSAWTVMMACDAGRESTMITAYGAQTRETALRQLRNAASQAVTAATSWPLT
ncbi:hypothetical protein JCM18918_838 [Cutibacterium acnes JCM 18918]|nr:hypothetical protein JCM18918_838 [Cutibacterium acnes JCM 18918]